MNLEQTIAHDLLSIGAVFLRPDEPFTWASGIKSPIYCDNRLTLTAAGDQKRIMTPEKAGKSGCDYIVVGRPITQAEDPVAAYRRAVKDFLG